MATSWLDFFNGEHALYVNDRHKALHDRLVARDVAALVGPGDDTVLDFGCGEATEAAAVAARCKRLWLSDAAPAVLGRVAQRFAGDAVIRTATPSEVEAMRDATLDLVVVNSLLQYLPRTDLVRWLSIWHDKLRPGGRLVLGDVIPPDVSPLTDAVALLRFGWEGGFLTGAVAGLVRTFFSDYRNLRAQLGLSTYEESDILSIVEAAGFTASRRRPNIGHNQARMTIVGLKDG
ncbi:class I SAM-dependent methyltransferase [uncultured Alsobacter sp.]|uniref:class I SAM-dependent methyltransferase n=1 Tax=uncultured Alsobacter sp. TaxID=1748258 RepID=UPI0025EBEEFF|nr:class I SAM-dependent methyltransferase [uncultured Alsobacter sp.]